MKNTTMKDLVVQPGGKPERRRRKEGRERAREADVTGRRQESVRAAEDERMRGKRTGET